ncbi:MBL fold metallo-hydrolase [Faunimonas sp. B44]|uniref:MBL fold metallo-hydrolase n=1 Tax=Faunimonas sp. B44 TaxID=3461493 RepID=UPI004043D579
MAENPGAMTYHGTNTYIVEDRFGTTVIDPGPGDEGHLDAVLAAVSAKVTRILLTHGHADHVGNAPALRAATGAPIYSHATVLAAAPADFTLADADTVAGFTAVHTPGHAPDHVCYAREDGLLFSGDHVMAWCSTVVGPPHGDMAAYLDSLRRLLARPENLYLPGHGPQLPDPRPFIQDLLKHRLDREAEIEAALRRGPSTPAALAEYLYAKANPVLRRAAERNVRSHLTKLAAEGRVEQVGDFWRSA